jgi:hypothetical protein
VDDNVRTEPGVELWKLFLIIAILWYSLTTGSIILLAIGLYLSFNSLVMEGFWPYLTEEQAREIRRKKIMGDDDDTSGDSQEQPPEDTDKHRRL